tara:strand:- start:18670 stop:18834 length:165 start_codon:yes stop_codon:yes gene_type:complete
MDSVLYEPYNVTQLVEMIKNYWLYLLGLILVIFYTFFFKKAKKVFKNIMKGGGS